MIEILLLLAGLALIATCGAFVAAEFAFITVDRASVERAAKAGDSRSIGTLAALRTLSTQLSGAQLGITVTNLAIGFLAEPAVADLLAGPLARAGLSGTAATSVSLSLALVIATSLTMIFGELVPKNLAIARPLATARAVQGFQRGFTLVMAWPIRFLNGTANRILRSLGVEPSEELASARSPQELASLVARSARVGTLEASTATLVQRSLTFGERRARDVLTPRSRVSSLPPTATMTQLMGQARSSGRSRFPVIALDGSVAGVVHVRQAVRVPFDQRDSVTVSTLLQPPLLVPESMPLDMLLVHLQRSRLNLAVVLDEFGSVAGVATLEDLIEEIVGDVEDEHDTDPARSVRDESTGWVLSALLRPDEVGRIVGTGFPESAQFETLGGLVMTRLGRLPVVGDRILVDTAPVTPDYQLATATGAPPVTRWELIVQSMDRHRIDRIRAVPAGNDTVGSRR